MYYVKCDICLEDLDMPLYEHAVTLAILKNPITKSKSTHLCPKCFRKFFKNTIEKEGLVNNNG